MTTKLNHQTKQHPDVMHSHNHGACLTNALQAAESICAQQNIRLTPARKRILELICASHKAIGAYDLLDQLKIEDAKAQAVTIYRALDFLIDAGLVHKVESANAYIGCLNAEHDHHSAILICDECDNAFEIDADNIYQTLLDMSQEKQFQTRHITLELHGVCDACTHGET